MADYQIKLGVKLNTSEIRSQISKYNSNSNNAKLRLGIKLDTRGISEQIRSINSRTPVRVNLSLNIENAQKQINNIRNQILELGRLRPRLNFGNGGGGTGRAGGFSGFDTTGIYRTVQEVNRAYEDLRNLQNRISSIRIQISGLDATKNSAQINELSAQLNRLMTDYNNLYQTFNNRFSTHQLDNLNRAFDVTAGKVSSMNAKMADTSAVQQQVQAYKELLSISQQIGKLEINIAKLRGQGGNTNQIVELESQLRTLQTTYQQIASSMQTPLTADQWSSIYTQIAQTQDKLTQLDAKYVDTRAKLARKLEINLQEGKFSAQVAKVKADASTLGNTSVELERKLKALSAAESLMNSAFKSSSVEQKISAYKKYEQALKVVENQLKKNKAEEQMVNTSSALEKSKTTLSLQMSNWLRDNSAAAQRFGADIQNLQNQLKRCGNQAQLNNVKSAFKNITLEAKAAGLATQTFADKIKNQFSKYSQYFSIASVFMYATRAIRDMFNQVKAIDSEMTELKKVTDETAESYNRFLTNAASRAKEIGTTIDGLVSSTADFARLGYGFEDAQGLAEVANIYAVVGDEIEGVEQATESLISTMAAFKDEAVDMSNTEFATSIIDKFNEIGNNFAISSGGIGEALKRSASSLDAANNTIDESIALITAANTVVQNPDKVGNAFKTISMRIRGAKTELEEAGESTEGMADSVASMREEIMALSGVDIMLNENTFKSTYAIMDELANKWEDLSDIAQASIVELMAGKHQGNVFASLMSNFDVAREALEVSVGSAGSAMKEHAKWSESLEARLLKLKATWQSLSQTLMSSDFLKSVLNGVIALVNGLDKLASSFGTFPTLIGIIAAARSVFSNKGFFTFDAQTKSVQLFGRNISDLRGKMSGLIGEYSNAQNAINRYNSLSSKSVSFQEKYNKALANSTSNVGKYLSGLNGAKGSMVGYIGSLVKAKAATIGLRVATVGLRVAAMAMNAAFTMGISFAISGIIKWVDSLVESKKELAETVEELTSKFREQHDELMKLKGDYDTDNESSMISKYEKLSKGVDNLGRNVSLTADEYSEYQSIVNQIADQIPTLVTGYDEQGNALLSCKGNVEQLTEAYEKLIHAQNREILSNSGKIEEDFENTLNESKNGKWYERTLNAVGLGTFASTTRTPSIDLLEKFYNGFDDGSKYGKGAISQFLDRADARTVDGIYEALKNAGIVESKQFWSKGHQSDYITNAIYEAMETDPSKIKGIVDNYYNQFADAVEEKKSIGLAKISEAFDVSNAINGLNYGNISEELQAIARQVVNSFDFNFLAELSDNGISVESWVTSMLNELSAISKEDSTKIETGFDLQTQFNGGDISYGEYINGLKDIEGSIANLKLNDETKKQLKISLGLDENGVVDQYEALVQRLSDSNNYDFNIDEDEARRFLDDLSVEEREVAIEIITEYDSNGVYENIEEIKHIFRRELMLRGLTFDLNLEVETAGIEALNTALTESVTATGLSSESISAIKGRYKELERQGYDLSSMFEETTHGIHLNRQELNKFEKELSSQKLDEVNSDLTEMQNAYELLGEDIRKCTDPVEKAKLFSDRQLLAQRISEAATLASQYQGLTSAYNDWLAAESAGNERDMYENVVNGFKTVKDELARGWADDSTIEFLELVTGRTDLAGKSGKELKKVYDDLDNSIKYLNKDGKVLEDTGYSVRDFFTVDDDGNATSKGVYRFLDAIGRLEEEAFGGKDVIKRDGNGNVIGFDFELAGGDEAIAEALGISEELVQIMVRAADDAGFVVNLDGTYKQLSDLQNEAKASADYLKEIGKTDFEFDFNTSSATNLTGQLEEANKILDGFKDKDGNINLNADGATEAMIVVSTLQAKLDTVTQEKYGIGLTVEEEKFEEPLEILQNYGSTIATLNQLNINPKANTEEIEKLEADLDTYATELNNLPDDIKVEIGLVGDDGKTPLNDIDIIKQKAENGEIKIPTVLDIQTNMDKNIETLADLALLNTGALSETQENTIRAKYDLKVEVDDVDTSDVPKAVNNLYDEPIGPPVPANLDVEVNADKVDTSGVGDAIDGAMQGALTGADGRLAYSVGTDVEANVENVDTSDVDKKTEEALQNGETTTIEKDVELELSVSEYQEVIQDLKEVDKDITIDVTVKGLDDVVKLAENIDKINKNIDLSAEINGEIDNLSKFAEGAKALSELDNNISTYVIANVEGNVVDTSEEKLDNLVVFSDGVKELQNTDSVYVNIDANINGNVIDVTEEKIDNIKVFAEGANALQDTKSSNVTINANINGNIIDSTDDKLNNIKVFAEGAKALQDIEGVNVSVIANADGSVLDSTEDKLNNISEFAEGAKALKGVENADVTVIANFEGTLKDSENIENLSKFVESAKVLQDVKSSEVTITANISGNILDSTEEKLGNIKSFAEGAKSLKDVGSADVKVVANVDGNVLDSVEDKLDNISEFANGAKALKDVGDADVTVVANIDGSILDANSDRINDIKIFAEGAKALQGVENVNTSVNASIDGNLDTWSGSLNDLALFAENAKALQGVESKSVSITSDINGNITNDSVLRLERFASIVNTLSNKSVDISVKATVDTTTINSATQLLSTISTSGLFKDYNATVNIKASVDSVDDSKVQEYISTEKEAKGKVAWTNDEVLVNEFKNKIHEATGKVKWDDDTSNLKKSFTATGTVTWTSGNNVQVKVVQLANGTANINGSAFANGAAYKQGNWGIKQTTNALTGELGQELVVYGNKYWTVGDNGAEFATIPKGAIVFNHKQTEELFKNGKVTADGGRGKTLANGTAFASGTAFSEGYGGGFWENTYTGKTYGKSSSSSSSSSDAKDEAQETIDWIEIAIERIERAIDSLDREANNIYNSWTERNKSLVKQIDEVGNEINVQQKAYESYMNAANGVGLDEEWAEKVRNGTIDFNTITDEVLKEKIDDYQNWFEKAIACKDAIEELKETESELYAQRFENVQSQYDAILQGYEHTESMLNEYISQAEEKGYIVSKKYYEALVANEKSNIAELKKQQSALIEARDEAVESGKISKNSEEWYDMCNEIDGVTQAIEESTTALLEFDNSMREIDWSIFDLIQERISAVSDEAEFLIELMSNEKLYDDDGKLTSQGMATMALHGQKYNTYMYQADDYGAQVAELNKQIAKDQHDQELINRRNELLELQRESILAAEDEKEAIRDMVEEGIELELDALQERIDKYNEALESQKDLYEYQKKVKEQTEEIASIQKQISAYSGDDSEEAKAKVQELQLELKNAEEELKETEYDKFISDTSTLLDSLYNEYELILNQRLDNIDLLLSQVIDGINNTSSPDGTLATALGSNGAIALALGSNATTIGETLNKAASSVGATLSNAMSGIWTTGDGNIKSVLSTYGKGFQDKQTTTNTVLGNIKADVNAMVDDIDKDAQKKIASNKTTTSAKKNTTTTSSTSNKNNTTSNNKTNTTSSKPNITDDTLMGIASAIWIYGNASGWGNNPFRENKLTEKIGAANAKKVQSYINAHGANGGLYNFWIKKGQNLDKYKYNAFKSGAKDIDLTQLAWTQEGRKSEFIIRPSDGAILTPVAKGDSILNASASGNIWNMANNPTDFIKDNLGFGNSNIPNGTNINNNITQHIDVTQNFPNVKSYEETLVAISKDPKFQKLINAMTTNQYLGGSSLAKGKAIR